MKKKIFVGALALCLFSGSVGVYAGKVIKQGKTPRGNYYSVEQENIEKNKYAVTVNGKQLGGTTLSLNGAVYVPLKSIPSNVFSSATYDSKKWTYKVNSKTSNLNVVKKNNQFSYFNYRIEGLGESLNNLSENYSLVVRGIALGHTDQVPVVEERLNTWINSYNNLVNQSESLIKSYKGTVTSNDINNIYESLNNINEAIDNFKLMHEHLVKYANTRSSVEVDYIYNYQDKALDLLYAARTINGDAIGDYFSAINKAN